MRASSRASIDCFYKYAVAHIQNAIETCARGSIAIRVAKIDMKKRARSAVLGLTTSLLLLEAGPSQAQAPAAPDPVAPSLPGPPLEPNSPEDLAQRIEELRRELQRKELEQRRNASRLSVNGYADIGFFAPLGNGGVGWVQDIGNRQYPEYNTFGWTFVGDILGTAVNTRGEPADLGNTPGLVRHDSIDSDGAGGVLVNEINLRVGYQIAERALLRTSINFVPRSGRTDFSLGDLTDVDLAEVEYLLTADGTTSVFAGKTLPVFGIEYKDRKSHQRFGVTPSPVHRYTSGSQLGLKVRSALWNGKILLAAAASNNSSVTEPFHFHGEIDKNWGKTLSGRAALSLPMIGAMEGDRLELGASGLWGPQDRATDNGGKTIFWGFDLQYLSADYALKAQAMKGSSKGRPEEQVWNLDLDWSGYVELDWQALSFLGAMARAGLRRAVVMLELDPMSMDRVYVTRNMQFTAALRVVFNPHALLKLEYVHNREYGRTEQIDNDVATSSLVLHF